MIVLKPPNTNANGLYAFRDSSIHLQSIVSEQCFRNEPIME